MLKFSTLSFASITKYSKLNYAVGKLPFVQNLITAFALVFLSPKIPAQNAGT